MFVKDVKGKKEKKSIDINKPPREALTMTTLKKNVDA